MSDIFYSQVDTNLQLELYARAAAGMKNRRTKDINYMVSKIANVAITPYDVTYDTGSTDSNQEFVITKTPLPYAILGGIGVRQGEYLPTGPRGFITDRINSVTAADGKLLDTRTNTSKRIPPYLTGLEVSIGDDSAGLMQTATVNVTIPNPGRDLDYFESVYLRPGRHVKIYIEYPNTAIVGETPYLTTESIASTEKLKALYPEITPKQELDYRKMTAFVFDGVIISFTLDYQQDASVAASLTMRGTTQVYTDLSMAMSDASKKTNSSGSAEGIAVTTFYEAIDKVIEAKRTELGSTTTGIYINETDPKLQDVSYIWGAPTSEKPSMKYITLKALINFVNEFILPKAVAAGFGTAKIVFDREINTCKYYENLISATPLDVFFPGQDNYGSFTWYGNLDTKKPKFYKSANDASESYGTLIYISTTTIEEIITAMSLEKTYTVAEFLSRISEKISYASGGAYDLKLITHPENQNALLYYDSNNVKSFSNVPTPFNVPMFANHPAGTIVKDFSFTGKLPSDAANLAYVLNQNPSDISESEIAPFLSYMYSATQTQRDALGNDTISNITNANTLLKIKQSYSDNNIKYLAELKTSIEAFGKNMDDSKSQTALYTSLQKYIQYPKSDIEDATNLKAPIIPFDVSFTVEGVNGFRYGDVLEFSGLPKRYTNNTVFCIIGITHSVSSTGEWNTSIQCIMRPRIDFV